MAKAKAKARTLEEINAEIDRLKKEAETVRAAEVQEVIGRIKHAIEHYRLTAADLGLGKGRGAKAGGKAAGKSGAASGAKRPSVIKYRDDAGHAWTGNGKRPRWYLDALASGKTPEDLLAK